ncbi:hypothetical protein QVD17_10415 [Tagetes erecta]|uniref:Uncharacterized protein n=1 Tax=Tagetes erecta TaxID=13708 RepID=A0AAD8P5X2_TARER|nr:hypothetical protein QVD17_10415 [Tagetes erecta]
MLTNALRYHKYRAEVDRRETRSMRLPKYLDLLYKTMAKISDLEHLCFELSDLAVWLHKIGKYYEVIKDVKEKGEEKER